MTKTRLEAFSDGVFAIIITIMVLELKVPRGGTLEALKPLVGTFLSYTLSFVFVGIYWNNHHHMLHAIHKVKGSILWANLHLLFWLSLVPFTTAWMGENHFAKTPVGLYGLNLLCCAIAYSFLVRALVSDHEIGRVLSEAIGTGRKKSIASLASYAGGVIFSFVEPKVSLALYTLVSLMWLVPDRRIEKHLREN